MPQRLEVRHFDRLAATDEVIGAAPLAAANVHVGTSGVAPPIASEFRSCRVAQATLHVWALPL